MGRDNEKDRTAKKRNKAATAFSWGLAIGMVTMLVFGGLVYFKMRSTISEKDAFMLYGDNCLYVNPPRERMEVFDNEDNKTKEGMCSRRFDPYLDCRFDIDPELYNKQYVEGKM